MKMKHKWVTPTLVALAVLAALVFWQMGSHSASETEHPGVPPAAPVSDNTRGSLRYPVAAPQLTMIESRVLPSTPVPLTEPLSARVVYDEDVTARIAVSLSGRIMALKASPGDAVRPGQVLAEIDSPDYGAATADLDKAKADEERKRLVLERAKALGAGEAIAAKELEAAQADLSQAHAETARATLRLKNMNPHGQVVQGQRIGLTSPIGGLVTERNATPGLEVSSGMASPLFVITDPKRLWLLVDLPENRLSRVKLGGVLTVESDAFPAETFNAKIIQLGQLVDPNTRRVIVRAKLDNPNAKLLPEMFVRATLQQDSGTGVRVPNSAIVNRGIYTYVFLQIGAAEFQRRQVKLLTQGSDFSFVGEGLKGGEQVVVTGALLLDAEMGARAEDKP